MRIGLAFLLICALGLSGCTQLFFQPLKDHVYDPEKAGLAYEDVTFEAVDGTKLHGWFFPARGERIGSILFLHGNAENISTHFAGIVWATEGGFDAFVIDYRGYGRSEGMPSLDGLHLDAAAGLDALLARPEVAPEDVVVFGQSLGGAIALTALAEYPQKDRLAGLVIEGAFSGYRRIAREKMNDFWLTWAFQWPVSLTIDGRYDPKTAASAIAPLPLLVVHGQKDRVVPPHHGDALFDAAGHPKVIWRPDDADHIAAFASLSMRKRLLDHLTSLIEASAAREN
jgi:fermentation-respiration switch protein FrsA (DUF1100 family)